MYYRGIPFAEVCATRNFEATAELLWDESPRETTAVEWKVGRDARARASMAWANARSSTSPGATFARVATVVLAIGESTDLSCLPGGVPSKHSAIADTRTIISALTSSLPGVRLADRTVAQRVWRHLARREPSRDALELIDLALVCLADHEIATSTFAVRIAASTRALPSAAIVSGLGVLSGPAHGSASGPVFSLLEAAHESGRPVRAINDALKQRKYLPGVGHKVYKTADPRHEMLMAALRRADVNRRKLAIVEAVLEETKALVKVPPNVDFALGALAFCCELPPNTGESIVSVARIAGWIAHYIEELDEPVLRYRVRANYRGK
jgi:citrate synthase